MKTFQVNGKTIVYNKDKYEWTIDGETFSEYDKDRKINLEGVKKLNAVLADGKDRAVWYTSIDELIKIGWNYEADDESDKQDIEIQFYNTGKIYVCRMESDNLEKWSELVDDPYSAILDFIEAEHNKITRTYYLLRSNQGNHTGFNRHWEVIDTNESAEKLVKKLSDIALNSSDNYRLDERGFVVDDNDNIKYENTYAFEHDLIYYTIESDDDMEKLEKYSTGHRSGIFSAIQIYNERNAK